MFVSRLFQDSSKIIALIPNIGIKYFYRVEVSGHFATQSRLMVEIVSDIVTHLR